MSSQGLIRVVLCDDHGLLRALVRTMLDNEVDITIVAEASDVAGLLCESSREKPDVVILDGRLHAEHGLDSIGALLEASPASRVLMFSSEADPAYLRRALALGAHGYLLKDSAEHLATAIRALQAGGTYVDGRLALGTAG